jgi:2-methylcitrate dehydratase PrpD
MVTTNQQENTFTAELARRALAVSLGSLSDDVIELSRQCVLDWLGVTLVGAAEPLTASLAAVLRLEGGTAGSVAVIGRSETLGCIDAALLNGTASHAIDYDDVNFSIPGHASAPVLAAALALGEATGASGRQLLEAFIAGYETSCRVGTLVAPEHYEMGFHATATVGTFGAAVACAKLLGLDVTRFTHAIGIAATRAAGLKSSFGTSCKPLQCGNAASAGVFAALLARQGFDAPADALGHRLGFAATHARTSNADIALDTPRLVRDFSQQPSVGRDAGAHHLHFNLFKFHAACYETHSAIECAVKIRDSLDHHAADEIEAVRILVNPHCNDICNIQTPQTSLETKFSLRMAAAFALANVPTASPASFSMEMASRPDVVALHSRIAVELTDKVAMPENVMLVTLKNGNVLHAAHDSSMPETDITKQGGRVSAKFLDLATGVIGREASERACQAINNLDSLPSIDGLIRLVSLKA